MMDANGLEIRIGARVAVAGRAGASIWLTQKVVVGMDGGVPILAKLSATSKARKYRGSSQAIMIL